MFNEREASSRSACWFQRGRSVVVQRRAPGALRESSSPVPGDQSGRPGDGRLPFGALRRAMPAVHASVQKRRWRRALPAVTQTYTELPASWPTLFWGSLSQDPLSAALLTRRRAPVRRPLRCAETPTSGSGGVARRGCSERGPRSTSVYTCTYTQPPKIARGERHRAADAVAGGRGADGVRPGPPRGRPASPPSRTARRLLAAGVWTTTSLGPPNCHTVVPPSRARTRSEPPAKSGLTLGRTRIP